eukprot:scaffold16582_cov75-Cyclotella_meneghiniana.AAC.4
MGDLAVERVKNDMLFENEKRVTGTANKYWVITIYGLRGRSSWLLVSWISQNCVVDTPLFPHTILA